MIPDAPKDNIAFLAAGYGLSREAEIFIHGTYTYVQALKPAELKKYHQQINEL